MLGQVYKVNTDSYLVKSEENLIKLKARGVFKLKRQDISVGDYVEFDSGVITSILPRKNKFIRPNVSNVDLIVAVISPEPKPDFYLLDKLLLNAVHNEVEFLIVVNKVDLETETFNYIVDEYGKLGIEIISISAKNNDNISKLKEKVNSKLTVLAGQSAVGKTSIVNSIFGTNLKVGDLSDKISRGKHTTTRSEIFEFENIKIIDSPGFAVIDAMVSLEDLPNCYPEYLCVANECKFRGCSHVNEPDCKVKELVKLGVLSQKRYDRYVEIYNEISKRRNIYEKN